MEMTPKYVRIGWKEGNVWDKFITISELEEILYLMWCITFMAGSSFVWIVVCRWPMLNENEMLEPFFFF